jgi:hypothetical protein
MQLMGSGVRRGLAGIVLGCFGWVLFSCEPATAQVIFSEDFESLTLGASVDEEVPGDTVWTKTPPTGWSIDDSGIPGAGTATDGVTEWAGWSFADKNWWATTAGDQGRTEFSDGSGIVAIADPDEWDDLDHPDSAASGWYNTFLSTSAISLAGAVPNTAVLTFDSSWRPEFDDDYHQTANITVSYDGGAAVEVLRWESDGGSANFHADMRNENVSVPLNNPDGASEMVLKFGLFDAGNDWWWAVDNISVSAEIVPEPSSASLMLFTLFGLIAAARRRG